MTISATNNSWKIVRQRKSFIQVDGEALKGETKALRDNREALNHGAEAVRGKEAAVKCVKKR